MLSVADLFKGRHFDRQIIILCVCWYLRYKLSFRDLVEMMGPTLCSGILKAVEALHANSSNSTKVARG
jgi:hypothetical protein